MTDPTDYLARSASAPFAFGTLDCGFWVGAWAQACCGVDPAAAMRGRYRTGRGCLRALRREGGLPALATRLMREHGFPELAAPEPGAIGLLDLEEAGATLGICAATGRWVCKGAPAGIVFPPVRAVLAIWSPRCRR